MRERTSFDKFTRAPNKYTCEKQGGCGSDTGWHMFTNMKFLASGGGGGG
jgi:hypothetical protein